MSYDNYYGIDMTMPDPKSTTEKLYHKPPKFIMKEFKLTSFQDGGNLSFRFNGNNNLIVKFPCNESFDNHINLLIPRDRATDLVQYLVEYGSGTNKGIGKVGDITKVGVGTLKYVMVTKNKNEDIPSEEDVYNNRYLIRPDEFVVYTLKKNDIKIRCTINDDSYGECRLNFELWNVPAEGITLPTTITDGLTNWLAYWFSSEAVAMRLQENRNKTTKFKGHHSLSNVYIDTDWNTEKHIMVTVFNDKNPRYCLILSISADGKYIRIHEYDTVTDKYSYFISVAVYHHSGYVTADDIIATINEVPGHFMNYKIKAKSDIEVFTLQFNSLKRKLKIF